MDAWACKVEDIFSSLNSAGVDVSVWYGDICQGQNCRTSEVVIQLEIAPRSPSREDSKLISPQRNRTGKFGMQILLEIRKEDKSKVLHLCSYEIEMKLATKQIVSLEMKT